MNITTIAKRDLYYSNDHEWISFQGSIAYVGVCTFKLIGFKEIEQLIFNHTAGFTKEGERIATVKYNDYVIQVHMPVDGIIVEVNESLLLGNLNILLQQFDENAWLALIIPSNPNDRKNLLLPKQYLLNGKSKFKKKFNDKIQ